MSRLTRLFDRFRSARRPPARKTDEVRWVVVGLGNPDQKYLRSRHNVGFMVVQRLAREGGARLSKRRFKGITALAKLDSAPVLLVQPQTFYNLSGECVAPIVGYFNLPPQQLIVVHDEMDLEPGRLRIKQGGGDAGNRGVRSIAQSLSSTDFIRVRVGIGHAPAGDDDKDYLLRPMTPADRARFAEVVERAADAVRALIAQGLSAAMNRFNQWP
jgi:PTH1 family peptidyl-tRNA hydrolase